MARKNAMAKIQPAMRTMTFEIGAEGQGSTVYIDLMQCASIVNRRFYRQGLNVAVGGFSLVRTPTSGSGFVQIQSLPNTWVLSNSWEKAFRLWRRQQDEALEDGQESVKARFNDFKVYFDQGHVSAGAVNNLTPVGYTGVPYALGEWDYSRIVVPNAGAPGVNWEPYMNMLGGIVPAPGNPSIGLIQAYANSRSTPQSPDPVVPAGITLAENVYRQMFDVGDNNDAVIDNAVYANNELPYDQDIYPGESAFDDQTEFVASINLGNTQNQTQVAGANFPCGLVKLDLSGLTGTAKLVIHLVPGEHRGYLCESMVDM